MSTPRTRSDRIQLLAEIDRVGSEIEIMTDKLRLLIRAADKLGCSDVSVAECARWSRGRLRRFLGRGEYGKLPA